MQRRLAHPQAGGFCRIRSLGIPLTLHKVWSFYVVCSLDARDRLQAFYTQAALRLRSSREKDAATEITAVMAARAKQAKMTVVVSWSLVVVVE